MKLNAHALLLTLGWEPAGRTLLEDAAPDYGQYRLSRKRFLLAALAGALLIWTAAYLFYHSFILSTLVSAAGLLAPRLHRQSLMRERQERLKLQFKEALFSLTSSLAAGRSLENAFQSALDDLKLLYPDPRTELLREFAMICNRLNNAVPMESALHDFAGRAKIDEIWQFVEAISICKRSGGDLVEVMKRTSVLIGEKLEVEGEIAVMIAQKRFEAKIMMGVPFIFLAFLGFAAPDYMAPLYGGLGYVLLTCALGLLLFCFWLMNRMMNISM